MMEITDAQNGLTDESFLRDNSRTPSMTEHAGHDKWLRSPAGAFRAGDTNAVYKRSKGGLVSL